MKKRSHSVFIIVCVVILTAAIASAFTALYLMGGLNGSNNPLQKYARLESIRQTIEREYYLEVDDEKLLNGALKGMIAGLEDPYSYYITPDEAQSRAESESRSYYGLGMTVQMDDSGYMLVVAINKGTPADTAGLMVEDKITEVNSVSVEGMDLTQATDLIRESENDEVVLTIVREGETISLPIIRESIAVSNLNALMLENNIGYIQITQFAGADVEDFRDDLSNLIEQGAKALIVDVRNNPGGYLDHAVAISDQLLPEALIVYTQNRNGKREDHYSDAEYMDIPLCVLVNNGSASAAEIFTAAIKDNDRGTIIGTQTYGKGIVQTVYSFEDDGAAMQFTSATYYTPNGVCIHGVGVTPDIVEEDENEQVNKAIEILTAEIEE